MDSVLDLAGGKLWVGRHSGDGDRLVFDPALAPAGPLNVSLFSLTHLRPRVFPRTVVEERIAAITDAKERAAAVKEYQAWPSLKATREVEAQKEKSDAATRQRDGILALHRAFLEARGITYKGVRDSSEAPEKGHKRARTACGTCGIRLDDFVGSRCAGCGGILCSCGACSCVAPAGSTA
jgi:hypothetical protein